MRPVGSAITLRVNYWKGSAPEEGDFLRTSTGRCYRIDGVRLKAVASSGYPPTLRGPLDCTVLERDAVLAGEPGVFEWRWTPR